MNQPNGLLKAFQNALVGLGYFFRRERNGRIQALIGVLTVAAGWFFHISSLSWLAVGGCIGLVLSAEMFNSALEKLCDVAEPGVHPQIRIIKDIAAAAVLWVSILSALAGGIIFVPKILSLF
jgi:diacylglycerol kinase